MKPMKSFNSALPFETYLNRKAVKYYESLDDKTAKRINKAIKLISNNPFYGTHIKRLIGGLEGKYRYKVGDLRIVYSVNKDKGLVFIEAIGPRGDIYK